MARHRRFVESEPRKTSLVRDYLRLSKSPGAGKEGPRFSTMAAVVSPVPLQSALREALASQAQRNHSTLQYAATAKELQPCNTDAALVFLNGSSLSQQGIVDELKQIQESLRDAVCHRQVQCSVCILYCLIRFNVEKMVWLLVDMNVTSVHRLGRPRGRSKHECQDLLNHSELCLWTVLLERARKS